MNFADKIREETNDTKKREETFEEIFEKSIKQKVTLSKVDLIRVVAVVFDEMARDTHIPEFFMLGIDVTSRLIDKLFAEEEEGEK